MKKLLALLIVTALVLSLAACGDAGKNDPSEPDTKETFTDAPQSDEVTDEPTTEQPDDTGRAEEGRSKILGTWTMNGVEEISLTFNEDGTGEYKYLDIKTVTFTYSVYITEALKSDECMIKVTYDTGDVEEFRFFFHYETGHLCFHNSEGGGYHGVIDYEDWTKK